MFFEVLQIAFASLRANKLRSGLTMLGIVIGIGSVIAVVALGTGAKQSVQERIAKLGTTLLQVNAQRIAQGGVQLADAKRMTMADVKMLEERATKLSAIQPQQDQRLMVQYGRQNSQSSVTGTTANFLEVRKYKLAAGRMFTSQDNEARRRVTVIGATPLANLGITEPSQIIGELVRIRGLQFEVIGVLAPKGQVSGFGDPDDQVLIPFETGRWRVFGTDRLNDINLLAMHEDSVNAAMEEVASIMRRAHRLRPGKPDDFTIRNQADFLNTLGATTEVFTYLLSGIASEFARWRYRHHEHHAGLRHRAHARDRHSQGAGRNEAHDPHAIPRRSHHAMPVRRCDRRGRRGRDGVDAANIVRLDDGDCALIHRHRVCVLGPGGSALRRLASAARGTARSDHRAEIRVDCPT